MSIWDEWADEQGNLGQLYGKQWRSWATADGRTVDQIAEVVERIGKSRLSRRLIVSAWNVGGWTRWRLHALPCSSSSFMWRAETVLPALPAQRRPSSACRSASQAMRCPAMMAQVCGLKPRFRARLRRRTSLLKPRGWSALQLSREPRPLYDDAHPAR